MNQRARMKSSPIQINQQWFPLLWCWRWKFGHRRKRMHLPDGFGSQGANWWKVPTLNLLQAFNKKSNILRSRGLYISQSSTHFSVYQTHQFFINSSVSTTFGFPPCETSEVGPWNESPSHGKTSKEGLIQGAYRAYQPCPYKNRSFLPKLNGFIPRLNHQEIYEESFGLSDPCRMELVGLAALAKGPSTCCKKNKLLPTICSIAPSENKKLPHCTKENDSPFLTNHFSAIFNHF